MRSLHLYLKHLWYSETKQRPQQVYKRFSHPVNSRLKPILLICEKQEEEVKKDKHRWGGTAHTVEGPTTDNYKGGQKCDQMMPAIQTGHSADWQDVYLPNKSLKQKLVLSWCFRMFWLDTEFKLNKILLTVNLVLVSMEDKRYRNVITDHIKLLLSTKQYYFACA